MCLDRVDTSITKQARAQPHGKRRRGGGGNRNSQPAEHATADEDVYHPVLCAVCSQVLLAEVVSYERIVPPAR